jgi:anti-anti-sigma regulatory factor
LQTSRGVSYSRNVLAWRPVSLLAPDGTLHAAGQIAAELREGAPGGVLLTGHLFGTLPAHARHLAHHLAELDRPWAVTSTLAIASEPDLLRLARASGCRALLLGPAPDPLAREVRGGERAAAAALRRIRRAGILTVVTCALGRPGDDAGVFGRAAWACTAGRVAFPRLVAAEDGPMSGVELQQGLAWTRRALFTQRAIWRRSGLSRGGWAVLFANYRLRRELVAAPAPRATPAMRLARALAQPIRIRERVPFVSTLVGAVHAGGGQVRSAWLRARAVRDETIAAVVIRLEGAVDARAARTLVTRVRRAIGGTTERIVIDLGGLELVSLTVLTRFVEENAGRLGELRGRLAFRNLRPAVDALRRNLHGMLPNAAVLEHALEETV